MKHLTLLFTFFTLFTTAQAAIVCGDGQLVISKDQNYYQATISNEAFVREVVRKLFQGVEGNCTGYCSEDVPWISEPNLTRFGSIVSKRVFRITGMRTSGVNPRSPYYSFFTQQYGPSVSLDKNGGANVHLVGGYMKGSHTMVSYILQHWYFNDCKGQL